MKKPTLAQMAQACLKLHQWPEGFFIDMTAGNGHDALFIARDILKGNLSKLIAIDIQKEAIDQCAHLFAHHFGLEVAKEICLFKGCHSGVSSIIHELAKFQNSLPQAALAMYNLGYLPGSDKQIITQLATTLSSLDQLRTLMSKGGVISIMLYPSHPGGFEEAKGIDDYLESWPTQEWAIWQMNRLDCQHAPYWVLVIKKS
jgi:hypothetical protein